MKTTISNWYIVSIMNQSDLVGKVLWGIVIDDPTCRFAREDYVCTSQIMTVYIDKQVIETVSGSFYKAIGKGQEAIVEFEDFELLRNGFSPKQIRQMNRNSSGKLH